MSRSADRYEDDATVVRRILAGDTDAFEAIVARWQGPLVNLAHRYCRERGMAEEMAQEAFLKVYRGLAKWRQDSRFSTWLFAVALNHYRSTMRRHVPPSVEWDQAERSFGAGDLGDEMHSRARDEAIRRAVATLPPKYRDVIVLYYFHEMDLSETARTAQLKEGTVKARLFRGRKLLEQKLTGMFSAVAARPREA